MLTKLLQNSTSVLLQDVDSIGKFSLVRAVGLEPTRRCHRGILSPLRLPVPPRPRVDLLRVFGFTRQLLCGRSWMLCKTCSRCVLNALEGGGPHCPLFRLTYIEPAGAGVTLS